MFKFFLLFLEVLNLISFFRGYLRSSMMHVQLKNLKLSNIFTFLLNNARSTFECFACSHHFPQLICCCSLLLFRLPLLLLLFLLLFLLLLILLPLFLLLLLLLFIQTHKNRQKISTLILHTHFKVFFHTLPPRHPQKQSSNSVLFKYLSHAIIHRP